MKANICLALSSIFLTACAAGGDGLTIEVDADSPPQQFASGTPITDASFEGRQFPFYYVNATETDGAPASTERGTAFIEFLSGDRFTAEINGKTMTFEHQGLDYMSSDGVLAIHYDLFQPVFAITAISLSGTPLNTSGFSGFESTTSEFIGKTTASYTTNGLGRIHVTVDNNQEVFPSLGLSQLDVDFSTGGVTGMVFKDVSTTPGHGFAVTLENGRLNGSRFDGDLDVDWTINGEVVETTVSNADVLGMFFGNEAEVIAGTYEADFSRADGAQGGFVGYFEAGETPPPPPPP